MIIYHGGTDIVSAPLVGIGRSGLDFGQGFYTTDFRVQAEIWARRIAARHNGLPIVNIYDFDTTKAMAKSNYLKFTEYNKSWPDFVASNRRGGVTWMDYDIIEGGVADDRVVDTVESYIAGLISADMALSRLIHYKPNNQICFISQQILDKCLTFKSHEIINSD